MVCLYPRAADGVGLLWLVQGHLLRDPEADTSPNQAQPDHQIALPGTVKVQHGIAKKARVDEEGWNPSDWMVLGAKC